MWEGDSTIEGFTGGHPRRVPPHGMKLSPKLLAVGVEGRHRMLWFVLVLWIYIIPGHTYTHMCSETLSKRTPNKLIASRVAVRGLRVWSRRVISFIPFCTVLSIYLFVAQV